jgi:hypothetical protein
MTHFSGLFKVVIDVPVNDHDRELAFWEAAVGQQLADFDFPEYHGTKLPGHDFWLLVQRLKDGAPRVHLDIHTDNSSAEVARLERLGAQRLDLVTRGHSWWVMRDPAGLPFCVIPQPPETFSEENARIWD